MSLYKNINRCLGLILFGALVVGGCQKENRPSLGDFLEDTNPPGGPLNFYVAFDGTSSNPAMNAVDSIRATFPADNPLTTVDGVRGKAVKGEANKFIKFSKPNDWAAKSSSFTISLWIKKNGQTLNDAGGNGPEYPISFRTSDQFPIETTMMLLLEGNNAACQVKLFIVDKNKTEKWLTWEGGNTVAGLLNDQWHHLAFSYDAGTSKLTLYIDGVANGIVGDWGTHGGVNLNANEITEVRIGGGPMNQGDTEWTSNTWKGSLDQLRLYSKALSAAEIQSLFVNKQ
jgi:hypothetical protein